jgi:hypothetical protein
MTSSDFYRIILFSRYEMKASLLFILLFIVYTLQDDVRFIWLSNGHHLHIFRVVADYLRKRALTDLALKFGKIITLSYTFDLFLDFAIYPSFKTSNMYHSTTPSAIARRYQGISFSFLTTQTYFTTTLTLFQSFVMFSQIFLDFKHSICLFKVIGRSQSISLNFVF